MYYCFQTVIYKNGTLYMVLVLLNIFCIRRTSPLLKQYGGGWELGRKRRQKLS